MAGTRNVLATIVEYARPKESNNEARISYKMSLKWRVLAVLKGRGLHKTVLLFLHEEDRVEELVHTLEVRRLQPESKQREKQCPKYPELVFLLNCLREIIGNF